MRVTMILPLAAAIALSACGSSEKKGEGPISADDAAKQMSQLETPRAGQYRTSIEVLEFDIPGMPKEQVDQFKQFFAGEVGGHEYCLAEADSANSAKDMAKALAEGDCTFKDFKAGGNSLYADMICKDQSGRQGNVKLDGTMSKEGSDMTMDMTQKMPDLPGEGTVHMKMHMVSKRVGDCPAGAAPKG